MRLALCAVFGAASLASCGGDDGGAPPAASGVSGTPITGSIVGIASGARVVLQNNGGDAITIASNGPFTFPTSLPSSGTFDVSVVSASGAQNCAVLFGRGLVAAPFVRPRIICGPAEERTFRPAAPMRTPRIGHRLVRLDDGGILAMGGTVLGSSSGTSVPVAAIERYDAATDRWSSAGALPAGASLTDVFVVPGGKVLALVSTGAPAAVSTLLYDPSSGTISAAGPFVRLANPTATVALLDGRLMATDGTSVEIYDPSTGTSGVASALNKTHFGGTLVVLGDGNVLYTGGFSGGNPNPVLSENSEVFDLRTGRWTLVGGQVVARSGPGTVLLPDGHVLMVGGQQTLFLRICACTSSSAIGPTEVFDPASGTWSLVGYLRDPRVNLTATLMPSGKVLVVGGNLPQDFVMAPGTHLGFTFPHPYRDADLYDPATRTWTPWSDLPAARTGHDAILTNEGRLLVTGGYDAIPNTELPGLSPYTTLQVTSSELGS